MDEEIKVGEETKIEEAGEGGSAPIILEMEAGLTGSGEVST